MENRIKHEIEHGKLISKNAENIWGWDTPAGKARVKRRANYLFSKPNFKKDDLLLEIGCGTGLFTEHVYKATKAKIIAIDVSENLLEIAKSKVNEVNFMTGNAMKLEFETEKFDGLYGSSVLHHLEMDIAIKEFYRVLKPGGKLVFAEPNMLNPQIFLQRKIPYLRKKMGDSPDETAIVRWRMKKLLQKTGFKNIEVFPYDFLHPAIPIKMIKSIDKIGKFIEKLPVLREIAGSVIIYATK